MTETAKLHAAAWTEMFDAYLRARADRTGALFVPFDPIVDDDRFIDGKPRADGTRSFLQSQSITLPEGNADDAPEAETVVGLGSRKNELILRRLREQGVEPYPGSVRYVSAVRDAGLRKAFVSSSTNTHAVLEAANIAEFFEACIDGIVAERDGLKGKPAPDTFLTAARALGVGPAQAALFEDALAGVEAGRAGGFSFVVGVERVGQAEALRRHGADIVVADLADLVERP